jgi:2-keto-4-pentenoate hydratase/2-oxohepta-3-ene-1,7-dioic acid hydratase in catechol pathway
VELGVVIGRTLRYADESEARRGIAGYCVINDISERGWQLERGGQWVKGKSADGFGPIGPWLVTADSVPNDSALRLWLEVDGRRCQDSSTAQMIFKPAFLASYLSQFMTLEPGDVISTGTPPGVGLGMKPPVYLRAGQIVRLGIDGLGVQTQRVVAHG